METSDSQRGGATSGIALVAGASRGLGLAVARELGRSGRRVLITARTAADLERAAAQLAEEGIAVSTAVLDVTDPAAAREVVARTEATIGPVDTLIAVAGVLKVGPLPDRAEDYAESIDIMLRGPINVVHAALPGMRRRDHGRIGVVTSIAAVVPTPHLVPYTAAKFGALGFARGLTEELSGTGISVSTIIPGLMRTGGHWHGIYSGRSSQEYAWFTVASALPVVSISAPRAAKIIVRGVLDGRRTIIFTLPARLGAVLYRIAPGPSTTLLGWAARLLPARGNDHQPGHRAAQKIDSPLFRRVTASLDRAINSLNQRRAHGNRSSRDEPGPD